MHVFTGNSIFSLTFLLLAYYLRLSNLYIYFELVRLKSRFNNSTISKSCLVYVFQLSLALIALIVLMYRQATNKQADLRIIKVLESLS